MQLSSIISAQAFGECLAAFCILLPSLVASTALGARHPDFFLERTSNSTTNTSESKGLNVMNRVHFNFQRGAFDFNGDFIHSPDFELTGNAIHWFLEDAIEIYDPVSESSIPSGARYTGYQGSFKYTASWSSQRTQWTWAVTKRVLLALADYAGHRAEQSLVDVSITSPDNSLFKFVIEKVPSTRLTLKLVDLYAKINYWAGIVFPQDPIPTSDAQNVIQQCLDYATQQARARRTLKGEKKYFSSNNVRLEYFFGDWNKPKFLPYTYSELEILLKELRDHFQKPGNHWTTQKGIVRSTRGAIAGYMTITEVVNLPFPPTDSSAALKLSTNTTTLTSSYEP